MKKVFCFIPGVLNDPDDTDAFTDNGVRWIKRHTKHEAIKCEYFSGVLTRRFFQNARVNRVFRDLGKWISEGAQIILVVHSNGGDIACRLIQKHWVRIEENHFFAAACDRDFEKNGINRAMESDRLGRVGIYGSHGDPVLKLAGFTGAVLKFFGLGYGTMGIDGPDHVEFPERVRVLFRDGYKHSTWWDEERFGDTMRMISGEKEKLP